MTHEADLDGRCENCGLLIGFHGTHETDDCVVGLKGALFEATTAMHGVLDVCRDRQAFVMMGLRAFARAENIVLAAFAKLNVRDEVDRSGRLMDDD
jgi:hypothetical protein